METRDDNVVEEDEQFFALLAGTLPRLTVSPEQATVTIRDEDGQPKIDKTPEFIRVALLNRYSGENWVRGYVIYSSGGRREGYCGGTVAEWSDPTRK